MDSVVYYTPLDGLGKVRLDLDACLRRIPLLRRDAFDFGKQAPMALNLTPEGRWVEAFLKFELFPFGDNPHELWYREIPRAYAAQLLSHEMGLEPKDLPPDLLAYTQPLEGSQSSVSDPGEETVNLSPPPKEKPPEPPVINYQALAAALLRENQAMPSKLVTFMADKDIASFQEVMDEVHGCEVKDASIRTLVNRTNNLLCNHKCCLSFSTCASQVVRHTPPE